MIYDGYVKWAGYNMTNDANSTTIQQEINSSCILDKNYNADKKKI
jgi:hypothetical protein